MTAQVGFAPVPDGLRRATRRSATAWLACAAMLAGIGLLAMIGTSGPAETLNWWNQGLLTAGAAGAAVVSWFGFRAASAIERPFRRAVLIAAMTWTALQAFILFETRAGIPGGSLVEFGLVAVFIAAIPFVWRGAVSGRLSRTRAMAIYLDSAIVFFTGAAGALLLMARHPVFDLATAYHIGYAVGFFGMVGATVILNLAIAPAKGGSGWILAAAGLAIIGLGFSPAFQSVTYHGLQVGLVVGAVGMVLTAMGGALWTTSADPERDHGVFAHRLGDALPLAAAGVAPLFLLVGEAVVKEGSDLAALAIDLSVAFILGACVLRQSALLRERNMVLKEVEEAVVRESDLHHDLETSERRFRTLVANSTDVFMIVQPDGAVTYQSPAVERVLGYPAGAPRWEQVFSLTHPDDEPYLRQVLAELTETPGAEKTFEIRLRHANGTWRMIEASAKNLVEDIDLAGIVMNYRDVTDRRRLEQQLTHEAFHDPLTGLANRALFADRVQHALTRRGEPERLAVLFMDLDDFKTINDSLGHAAGDQVLKAVAERLRACLRAEDTVARLGGDEFGILVEDADPSLVEQLGTRVLDALQAPFEVGGKSVHLGISIGTALDQVHLRVSDELLRNADVAMYTAKNRGKARVEAFEASMHAAAVTRLELKADLERALERAEMRLRYQPIFHVETGVLASFEALLRWRHPERGDLGPMEFVPLAEETGLIVPIGKWVLEQACRQAQAWRAGGRPDLVISVNLSSRQLRDPYLVAVVAEVLARTGLPPDNLILELTESGIMQDDEGRLQALRGLGLHLGLDDFGTGYSSLSYLSRFPIETLKIDRSFTARLGGPEEETALVRSVIQLAQSMGMETVAEGIERPEQLSRVRELGCTYGQGYLLARPMDAIKATTMIRTNRTLADLLPATPASTGTGDEPEAEAEAAQAAS